MANPLFSTYKKGENRVTSTILTVFEHISGAIVEDVLETVLNESEFPLVTFENQVAREGAVPDAAIRASTSVWFETKTKQNAVDRTQIEAHLDAIERDGEALQRLIVLTPDHERPSVIDDIDDDAVVWTNFDALVSALETILEYDVGTIEEAVAVPTEREAFLLRELVRFLYDEELVSGVEDRVVVVAAGKHGWPEYQEHSLYACSAGRSFRPVNHMAFYVNGEIKESVPRVTGVLDEVVFDESAIERNSELTADQKRMLHEAIDLSWRRYGETLKVFFLDEAEGITLAHPIKNDKTAVESNRRVAYVQGKRYNSLSALRQNPERTTELEDS